MSLMQLYIIVLADESSNATLIQEYLMATSSNDHKFWQSKPTRRKKSPTCSLCKNHKEDSIRKLHQCPYSECLCLLCISTRNAQKIMQIQQRFWRYQKEKLKNYQKYSDLKVNDNGQLKGQVCDKCRNHNHLIWKKSHNCPYEVCECVFCSFTDQRREATKQQRRASRSTINNTPEPSTDAADVEGDNYDYQYELETNCNKLQFQMNSIDAATESKESSSSYNNSLYPGAGMNITTDTSILPPLIPIGVAAELLVDDGPIINQAPKLDDIFYRFENSMAELDITSPPPHRHTPNGAINSHWVNLQLNNILHGNSNSPLSRLACSMPLQPALSDSNNTYSSCHRHSRASPPPLIPFDIPPVENSRDISIS